MPENSVWNVHEEGRVFSSFLDHGFETDFEQQEIQTIEHLLGIFASLLRLLPGGSAARIRTLAKFMEKDYEKIEKLVKLRRDYASRVSPVEQAIEKERKNFTEEEREVMAVEWLSRRFDAGLFSLQVRRYLSRKVAPKTDTNSKAHRCDAGVACG